MAKQVLSRRQALALLRRRTGRQGGRFAVLRTIQAIRIAADDLGMTPREFLRECRRVPDIAETEYGIALANSGVRMDIATIVMIITLILEILEKLAPLFE